jgi:formamidopyrimidine-DNA glycosylase
MTDFFNEKTRRSVMCDARMTPNKRVKTDFNLFKGKLWRVHSVFRGKEVQILFQNYDDLTESLGILLHFYKGGFWKWYASESETREDPNYGMDHRFSLHFDDGSIIAHLDPFHQSYWKWTIDRWGGWGHYKSPDIVFQNNDYRRLLHKYRNYPLFDRPIYDIMLHPWFFNGISNISRCEILSRTRFSPFTKMKDVLATEIFREDFFEISKTVLEEMYFHGGSQFTIWKNPFGVSNENFMKWIRIYSKGGACKIQDSNGYDFFFQRRWEAECTLSTLRYHEEAMKREELHGGELGDTDIYPNQYKIIKYKTKDGNNSTNYRYTRFR